MMHLLGFPFTVAIAQLLLSESDQATVPNSVPPMLPNSPFLNAITSDIDSNSYDFRNVNPVDMNLVTSNPTVSTDQLPPELSPFTSNDLFSDETLKGSLQTGLDQYGSSCNSVSTTTSMKVRRDKICPAPGQSPIERFGHWINGGLDEIANPLLEGEPSEEDRNQDTTEGKNPKGTLSEEEEPDNDKIYQEDEEMINKFLNDHQEEEAFFITHEESAWQACAAFTPNRPKLLCCMGPPVSRASGVRKRDPVSGVDMKNCVLFFPLRPMCTKLNPPSHFCCLDLDFGVATPRGWLGRNCVRGLIDPFFQ